MAVRQGRFSTNAYDTLALGTVRNTIQIYLRPGKTANKTQPRTTTYSLASFYWDNSEPSKMQTNLATNNNCFLLCHALVVRICQSPTTRKMTHQNTPTTKSPLLSRMDGSSNTTTPPSNLWMHLHYFWNAKEGGKGRYSDPNGIGWHHIVSRQSRRSDRSQDPILPWSQQWHSNFRHLEIRSHRAHHLKADIKRASRCCLSNWRGRPSQDAKVDLKLLIVAIIPIYCH